MASTVATDRPPKDEAGEQRARIGARSAVLLAGGMACFGSATPVSRIVGRSFPVWLGSGLRMAVAAAVLLPILAMARSGGSPSPADRIRSLDRRDRLLLAGIAAIGTFGFSALMFLGMQRAPGAVGAVVMATTPAVTAVGAVVFLGDRLGRARVLAVVLAVAGVVLVNTTAGTAHGAGDQVLLGSALVFGAVVCEAAYSLMGKRLTANLSPLLISSVAAAGALVLFVPLAAWDAAAFDWARPSAGQWAAAVWWGAGTMGLGSWLWFQGMRRVQPGTAAAFMGVMPVSALVLSYLLLGEAFSWLHLVGMALVLVGLVAVVRAGATVH